MDIKGEANLIKAQIEKVADKITIGVNKEDHSVNIYYVDNRQINFSVILPEQANKIEQPILEERVKKIVGEELKLFKDKLIEGLHKDIAQLTDETLATFMVSTSGDSITASAAYIATGNNLEIKLIKPEIKFI